MRRFWSLRMCSAAVTQLCAYLWEMREVEGAWHLGRTVTVRSTFVSGIESVQASILCCRSLSSTVHSCSVAKLYIRSRRQRLRNCVMPFRSAQTREVSASSSSSYLQRHQWSLGSGRARWSVTAPFRVALLCCRILVFGYLPSATYCTVLRVFAVAVNRISGRYFPFPVTSCVVIPVSEFVP
jgi:hypothetical protein